jgi:hypothetical protein
MPRQCPDRSTFRAGRNLPDKEFRYLRTVIVTAAVYRGFVSDLAALHLTFRHWAGLSPYTSTLRVFAGTGVFGKQSPGPALCDPLELHGLAASPYRGAPSPEVTGPICRVPWHGFSRPPWYALPAHLCRFAVRSRRPSLEAFLGSPGSIRSDSGEPSSFHSPLGHRPHGFAYGVSLPAWRAPKHPRTYLPASPHRSNGPPRDRILNLLSIGFGSRLRLRPASPAADQHRCGTLGHSVGRILTFLALLVPTFALRAAPGHLPVPLLC